MGLPCRHMLALLLLGAAACGESSEEALFSSASENDMPRATRLIDKGADVNARNAQGATPLHIADSTSMALLLLEAGADINALDGSGQSALVAATRGKNLSLVNLLLEKGADPNADNAGVPNALFDVPTAELAGKLIEHGAKVDEADAAGVRPLHVAAARGRIEVAALLIEHGADVNAQDNFGNSPLHFCMNQVRPNMAEFLLGHGAQIDAQNKMGMAPLHYAAKNGIFWVLRSLILGGANVTLRSAAGDTPFDLAVGSGHIAVEEFVRQSLLVYPALPGAEIRRDPEMPPQLLALFERLERRRNATLHLTIAEQVGQ